MPEERPIEERLTEHERQVVFNAVIAAMPPEGSPVYSSILAKLSGTDTIVVLRARPSPRR